MHIIDSEGYTWYFGHLISFIVITATLIWACKQGLTGHTDKFLHIGFSAGITITLIGFFNIIHVYWWLSPIIAFMIGIGKEIYDYFHPKNHTCDIMDLLSDLIGAGSITIFYLCSFVLKG
jgi:hypothetical protein